MTTPRVAYLARKYGCAAGAVISASHNPMEIQRHQVLRRGRASSCPTRWRMRSRRSSAGAGRSSCPPGRPGPHRAGGRPGDYLAFLKGLSEADLTGLKIVVDCANGAASALAPQLLRDLGAEVVDINDSPDGRNINDHCGSTYLKPPAAGGAPTTPTWAWLLTVTRTACWRWMSWAAAWTATRSWPSAPWT